MRTVTLSGAGGELRLDEDCWLTALLLPIMCGCGRGGDWPFVRFGDNRLADQNAREFADAVQQALDGLVEEPVEEDELPSFPRSHLDDATRLALRDLMEFCRAGGFAVR
jgi:hypothetical protein